MKLWDLRMALTTQRFEDLDATRVTDERPDPYEYRWGDYDDAARWFPHPHDNSLVTFRGHRVRWTLIRCHFSPPGSTDSRYVYSGSFDGGVYVWNLDATLAARIDVRGSTGAAAAGGRRRRWGGRLRDEVGTLVRDVGWHPSAPLLVGGWSPLLGFCCWCRLTGGWYSFGVERDRGWNVWGDGDAAFVQ